MSDHELQQYTSHHLREGTGPDSRLCSQEFRTDADGPSNTGLGLGEMFCSPRTLRFAD